MDDYENIDQTPAPPPPGKTTFDLNGTTENGMICPHISSNWRFISTYLLMKRQECKQMNLPAADRRKMKF